MAGDVAAALEGFLCERLGADAVRVENLERNTEGFSQETFSLEAVIHRGDHRERCGYVVKREPPAGLLEPYDLEPEFRVLHALSKDDFPSPPTPWFVGGCEPLERPFYVMQKLPGEVPVPAAGPEGNGPFSEGQRRSLAPQIARALARLHEIDWRERGLDFLGAPAGGRAAALRELARWEARIERSQLPISPLLADALQWLRANAPASEDVTLVHGDYRVGNFLVELVPEDARLIGVLDWEMVHLGDPLEDLAWCCSELWRGGTPNVGTLVSPEAFADAYAEASGRRIDAPRMQFYGLLAVVKMIAIMLTGIRAFRDGRTRDLRMAIFDHQLPFLNALLAVKQGWLPGG